jgi:hypothetical protein
MMTRKPILLTACLLLIATSAKAHSERYPTNPYQASAVRALAHELEQATDHLYEQMAESRRHYGHVDSWVLRRLKRLESEAGHFHRQVESRRQKASHTHRDYRDLKQAFVEAARAVEAMPYGHARRDFERISYLMRGLEVSFEGRVAVRRHDRLRVIPHHRGWWYR